VGNVIKAEKNYSQILK